jgi:hypothetical protein
MNLSRNQTDVVDPIAAVNNYLLPLWMIVFRVYLVRQHPDFSNATISRPDSLTIS